MFQFPIIDHVHDYHSKTGIKIRYHQTREFRIQKIAADCTLFQCISAENKKNHQVNTENKFQVPISGESVADMAQDYKQNREPLGIIGSLPNFV